MLCYQSDKSQGDARCCFWLNTRVTRLPDQLFCISLAVMSVRCMAQFVGRETKYRWGHKIWSRYSTRTSYKVFQVNTDVGTASHWWGSILRETALCSPFLGSSEFWTWQTDSFLVTFSSFVSPQAHSPFTRSPYVLLMWFVYVEVRGSFNLINSLTPSGYQLLMSIQKNLPWHN